MQLVKHKLKIFCYFHLNKYRKLVKHSIFFVGHRIFYKIMINKKFSNNENKKEEQIWVPTKFSNGGGGEVVFYKKPMQKILTWGKVIRVSLGSSLVNSLSRRASCNYYLLLKRVASQNAAADSSCEKCALSIYAI